MKCSYCRCPKLSVFSGTDKKVKYDKNGLYYHQECLIEQQARDHFCAYVCFLFGLKKPGPRIYSQIKTFMEKYNYTYLGMENSLRYFYEVKKNKDIYSLEDKTIGIIPHIYNEAQDYFNLVEHKREKIQQELATNHEEVVVVPIAKKKPKVPTYNIDEIT